MPRVIKPVEIDDLEKELHKDYFDRHTPHVYCDSSTKRGEKLKVKVKIGDRYTHPDDSDHYIKYVQLWNRETLLTEVHFTSGTMNKPEQVEVDFYLIPSVSMNLTAMSCCTKHGLWESAPFEVKVIE
jgi:superoxide reductase